MENESSFLGISLRKTGAKLLGLVKSLSNQRD